MKKAPTMFTLMTTVSDALTRMLNGSQDDAWKEVCDADTSCVAIDHRSDENTGHKCDTVSNYGTCCTYQICTKNVASKSNCETLSTAGFFNAE